MLTHSNISNTNIRMRYVGVLLFYVSFTAAAAHYPLPAPTVYSGTFTGPVYGDDHLANHAASLMADAKQGQLTFELDELGRVKRILGEPWEGTTATLHWHHWHGNQIDAVDLSCTPSAPDLLRVRDPLFMQFIQELINEHHQWKAFIETETGPMNSQYSTTELKELINKSLEVRVRIKLMPERILSKLGLKVLSTDPFRVTVERTETLSRDKVLSALKEFPFSECEKLLKTQPLLL